MDLVDQKKSGNVGLLDIYLASILNLLDWWVLLPLPLCSNTSITNMGLAMKGHGGV
jgi:hypothetical protein